MNKLIITLSGKKQAGKNTACNLIVAKYLNLVRGGDSYFVNNDGHLQVKMPENASVQKVVGLLPSHSGLKDGNIYPQVISQFACYGVKVYSFADPLKRFCIDVLGCPENACYGTDAEKNIPISHLLWDNLPDEVRAKSIDQARWPGAEFKTGPMTGRDIMQVMGTDICRRLYGDCWARGTYNTIKREGHDLALICDGRFPNEIMLGTEVNAKSLRLLRNVYHDSHLSETALDGFPPENYTHIFDNSDLTIEETCDRLSPLVVNWFKETGIE